MVTEPFAEWLPDLPDYENPGSLVAKNVFPAKMSYRPIRALNPSTGALDARCQGAVSVKNDVGNSLNFAGDATKLYELSGTTWSNVSGATYATPTTGRWVFDKFGPLLVASNGVDSPQKFDLATGGTFSALGGTPPSWRVSGVVREFLVVGNIASESNRFRWCSQNNVEDWPSANQRLIPNGGAIQGIIGGEYGTMFQEQQIARLTFVGPPTTWIFDVVEEDQGVFAAGSLARRRFYSFYMGCDDFYAWDGTKSVPIGHEKVNKTIFGALDQNYLDRVSSVIDPINKLYILSYPGTGNVMGTPNRLAIYNYEEFRWSEAEFDHEILQVGLSEGVNLDNLTTVFGEGLDTLPFGLDSRAYQGGAQNFGAFNTSHQFGPFNGATLEATIGTADRGIFPDQRAFVSAVRPLIDADMSIRVGTKDSIRDAVTWGPWVDMNEDGYCPVEAEGRYHRMEGRVAAGTDWSHAQGLRIEEAERMGRF